MNTLLERLWQDPLIQSLGWTLLHFVWQGAILAGIFGVVRRVLRSASANTRYLAGCATLLLMLSVLAFTYARQAPEPPEPARTPPPFIATQAASPHLQKNAPDEVISVKALTQHQEHPHSLSAVLRQLPASLTNSMPWFVGAWFAGVALFSFRLFTGWLKILSLRSRHNQAVDAAWLEKLQRLKQRLGVSRPVRMLQSWAVEVPTAIGWLCPVILLPASSLVGLTPGQVESIIAHELAHIRRHDYLVNLLQCLAETLLFYHPAVWWVSKCIRAERENCCDDLAVQVCGDALGYAQALAALEELRTSPATLAMAANGKPLLQRIRRLLGQGTDRQQTLLATNTGGILGVLLILALSITLPLAHSQKPPTAPKLQNTTSVTTNKVEVQNHSDISPQTNPPLVFTNPLVVFHTRTFKVDPNIFPAEINRRAAKLPKKSYPQGAVTPADEKTGFPVRRNGIKNFSADANGNGSDGILLALQNVLLGFGIDLQAPGRQLFYGDRLGMLMVRATLEELDKVEKFLQVMNRVPPQLTFEVKFAEMVEQKDKPFSLGDVLKGQSFFQTTNASQFTNSNIILQGVGANATHKDIKPLPAFNPGSLAIITDPQYRSVVKFFETQAGTDLISAPRVTTLSERQAQIKIADIIRFPADLYEKREQEPVERGILNKYLDFLVPKKPATLDVEVGPTVDVVGYVAEDTATIQISAFAKVKEFLGYDLETGRNYDPIFPSNHRRTGIPLPTFRERSARGVAELYDGQTLVLDAGVITVHDKNGNNGNLPKRLFIFITPTIIDPAGNRVHPEMIAETTADRKSPRWSKTAEKINTIIISEFKIEADTISEVAKQLTAIAKQNDPDHKGVNFMVSVPLGTDTGTPFDTKLVIDLKNVSLANAIERICRSTGFECSALEHAIVLTPKRKP